MLEYSSGLAQNTWSHSILLLCSILIFYFIWEHQSSNHACETMKNNSYTLHIHHHWSPKSVLYICNIKVDQFHVGQKMHNMQHEMCYPSHLNLIQKQLQGPKKNIHTLPICWLNYVKHANNCKNYSRWSTQWIFTRYF